MISRHCKLVIRALTLFNLPPYSTLITSLTSLMDLSLSRHRPIHTFRLHHPCFWSLFPTSMAQTLKLVQILRLTGLLVKSLMETTVLLAALLSTRIKHLSVVIPRVLLATLPSQVFATTLRLRLRILSLPRTILSLRKLLSELETS